MLQNFKCDSLSLDLAASISLVRVSWSKWKASRTVTSKLVGKGGKIGDTFYRLKI